ncbi:MAG: double-strand break repair helicase AddA [Henriciella sp.]|nr:double-strand break repair helicase AddA [Henriciella sp.]
MTEVVFSPDSAAFEQAKQAQANAAQPGLSAWVEANAGSGKTKVLIDRVARLLLQRPDGRPGAPPDSILCITYTKAAANEMLSRLFSRLGDWSVADDDALRDKLAELEGRSASNYSTEDLRQARALFARALETPGGLRIETIHAFCARILRRFPLEAGVSPGFQEMEDDDANALWQAVLSARLEAAAESHPAEMKTLAEATGGLGINAALDALKFKRQEIQAFARAIGSDEDLGPHIRAAAGAGDAAPGAILHEAMVTELPESELRAALEALSAIDKLGASDLKLRDALSLLLDTNDARERYEIYMRALAGAKGGFPSGRNPFTAKAGPLVADLFTRNLKKGDPEGREITRLKAVQAELTAAEAAERTIALMRIGLPMVEAYSDQKRRRGALDFDDLIECTRRLLTRSNAAEWVLYKLDGGLTHLLLDEAQDTSPPQWALINAIVTEFQAGRGRGEEDDPRTQFVVGDPKQSIYSFQGADQQQFQAEKLNFISRETVLAEAADRPVNQPEMAMSFRSTPQVLGFVDEVRARVPLSDAAIDPLPPVDADLKPHTARRANQDGRVELWPLEMPTVSESDDDAWTTPTDHVPADAPRRRLARRIAAQVRQMIDSGESVWQEQPDRSWVRKAIRPEDILILVRSRNELFDALIESLKQEAVPVAGADRLRLLDNLGVQDCLNLIRFALQPGDDLTLAEILRGPFCDLVDDDRHLFTLAHDRGNQSLWQRLASSDASDFQAAKAFCRRLIDNRHLPAFEFLTHALTERDTDRVSGWDKLIRRLGEPVRDPVHALLSGALSHDMTEAKSLQAYLSETEGRDTVLKRELGEPDGAVRVMTVHGAKGLQSPVVILPDTTGATKPVSDALFFTETGVPLHSPSSRLDCRATAELREATNLAAEKESRRLLYVALTRASDRLIIAGAGLGSSKTGYAKSSWFRWCLTAMQALVGGADEAVELEEMVAYGNAPIRVASDSPLNAPALHPPDWLKRPAAAPAPPARLAAPSRLTEDHAAVRAPFGPDRSAALRRGRLIHALLQTLPELPHGDWRVAGRRFLSRDPDVSGSEAAEMLDVTLRTLNDPGFADIFAPGGRNEAAIVGALPSGQMVNGRVDRLIIDDDQVLIIDYKTDRPAPVQAADVDLSYLVQMAAYRAVLQSLYPERPVRCALLYTDGPHLIELDGQAMSESLNRVESRV